MRVSALAPLWLSALTARGLAPSRPSRLKPRSVDLPDGAVTVFERADLAARALVEADDYGQIAWGGSHFLARHALPRALADLPAAPSPVVLELGCGVGLASAAAKALAPWATVVATDASEEARASAGARARFARGRRR